VRKAARGGSAEIDLLLDLLDEAFDRRSWHGPNLSGSIRGLTARDAAWRPRPGAHNAWELVVHAAYWKYVAWRQLTGAKRGSFAPAGSNWFPRPADASERAWRADLARLAAEHRRLRAAVAGLRPKDVGTGSAAARRLHLVRGIAAHDLYHAGQIQLLKRLRRRR
jgi:hypothetical protein